ncbi:acetyltransferase [Flavobacterium sp. F-328]|uniref:Acetyltransferase n=1 Tax=Flavobacterium erciyesense TaxID=2825842 RepID=A0ABS5D6L1_9FLAO|nr:acetyltransferase [Flavobacterium erciyesense]MBQ0909642.1 acetyltransferase [Flavobacterium erciyesense]
MAEKLFLYGASGHGKVLFDLIQSNNQSVDGVVDDNPLLYDLLGVPVYRSTELNQFQGKLLISIGDNAVRKGIARTWSSKKFFKAIHPKATVSSYANVGVGSVVMAHAVVHADVQIGVHCIVNTGALVEHDCSIGDFVHISPNAAVAGNVIIGEGTHVGIGACIIQGIQIGKWVTIGAGAVIIKDVPDYAVVVGNPGKIIKYKKNE